MYVCLIVTIFGSNIFFFLNVTSYFSVFHYSGIHQVIMLECKLVAMVLMTTVCIYAHQGFCVYKALAHRDMIKCILSSRRLVYNESFHCCND